MQTFWLCDIMISSSRLLKAEMTADIQQIRGLLHERNVYHAALEGILAIIGSREKYDSKIRKIKAMTTAAINEGEKE